MVAKNTRTVTVRLDNGVYTLFQRMAEAKHIGISAYLRVSLTNFAKKVSERGVYTKRREVAKTPELDADGHIIPEM